MLQRFLRSCRCRPVFHLSGWRRLSSYAHHGNTGYDVIVVGGGHAGTEAACAAARMGANTLLVTHKSSTIGEMSCNPSFGGVGKGHLMKEIDALGGVCAQACDETGVNYRVLNKSKGPAVWGPRAQIDRTLYKKKIQEMIFSTPNLSVLAEPVEDLVLEASADRSPMAEHTCSGVLLGNGEVVRGKTVVLTTGTFLRGCINIGPDVRPAGRMGDAPTIGLANTLERLGFKLSRLKTGTPPRIDANTIDFSKCTPQHGDDPISPFSYMSDSVKLKPEEQLPCYQTYAPGTDEFRSIILDNMHLNRHVREEVTGPRYCPSIESKMLRFPKQEHLIWLEPEGFSTDLVYPQGLACTLPADLQQKMVNLVPGLENATVVQPGYGVEYDFMDPRQIKTSLETLKIENLFFAGQINGTTGYEEAGAQGIIAGINAVLKSRRQPAFTVSRTEGYTGVLIDDLTTQGTSEPYRMFTSRAEYRIYLRSDNADLRLTEKGYEVGCVSEERYARMCGVRRWLQESLALLGDYTLSYSEWERVTGQPYTMRAQKRGMKRNALTVLVSGRLTFAQLLQHDPATFAHLRGDSVLQDRLRIEALYHSHLQAAGCEMEEVRREEQLLIPDHIDYNTVPNLSNEIKEKLLASRPETMAAATRIQGITPAALYLLLCHVKKHAPRTRDLTATSRHSS